MYRTGLVLGKFAPLHRGHQLLFDTAVNNCRDLVVLLDNPTNPTIPYNIREHWLEQFLVKDMGFDDFIIMPDNDYSTNYTMDEHGTITDETFWNDWLGQHYHVFENVDVVFTSDRYGAEIAKRIGAKWFPVDPDREVINISSTDIRNDMVKNWKYINDYAKPYMGTTVAIVGAESTGKSTLTKWLANEYGTTYAPEYGRIAYEANPELTGRDFLNIYNMQNRFIEVAQINGTGLTFTDTEAITTSLFEPIYLGVQHDKSFGNMLVDQQHIDLYLVLAPNMAMVQDGTRVLNDDQRQTFHENLVAELKRLDKKFIIIDDCDYDHRNIMALGLITNYLYELENLTG